MVKGVKDMGNPWCVGIFGKNDAIKDLLAEIMTEVADA